MNTAKLLFLPNRRDRNLLVPRVALLLAESDRYSQRARRINRMDAKPAHWQLLYQACAKESLHLRTKAEMVTLQLGVDLAEAIELHRQRRASKRLREHVRRAPPPMRGRR